MKWALPRYHSLHGLVPGLALPTALDRGNALLGPHPRLAWDRWQGHMPAHRI